MSKLKEKIIRQFLDGDDTVFPEIYRNYQNKIHYMAFSVLHNSADAEEVVQETFIKIIKNRGNVKETGAFNSWVFRITYNCSLDIYRRNVKYSERNEVLFEDVYSNDDASTEEQMVRNELFLEVKEEINKLPNESQRIATLRFVGDLNIDEIAQIMNMPEGTIKSRLYRIRKILQKELTNKKITPSRYLMFSINPLTVRLFQRIVESESLSMDKQDFIYKTIAQSTEITTIASVGVQGVSTAVTVAIISSSILIGGTSAYIGINELQASNNESEAILEEAKLEEINFDDNLTNKNLQIVLRFDNDINEELISIIFNNESIEVHKEDQKTISFIAKGNGIYNFAYGDFHKDIAISNIDKSLPEIVSMEERNGLLQITAMDDLAGVDFSRSYFISNNQRISFKSIDDKNMIATLQEQILANGELRLYDHAGNYATFDIKVNDIVEAN